MINSFTITALSLLGLTVLGEEADSIFQRQQQQGGTHCDACSRPLRRRTKQHKEVYCVGVLADRGIDAAFDEFNATFADYLTATAGTRFDPPIRFELKPLDFVSLFSLGASVDFIYTNPSAFSCIASEYGANSLVSQISRRVAATDTAGDNDDDDDDYYDLTMFGGVIFTRADNDDIHTLHDIKGHSIACTSISSLGSGQMQFRLLQQAGLSYLNDPSQVAFTSNQETIVNGVLTGKFDIGFVRTDQMERTIDTLTGLPVNTSLFKVIGAQEGLEIDGEPFPFESSTPLYPEWNVASLSHVPGEVAQEVQTALLDLSEHANVWSDLTACENDCFERPVQVSCLETCADTFETCRTTRDLAELALTAKTNGAYSGWRSTLSYFELRNMQEETGFISMDPETGINRCVRSDEIYDAIVCPPGTFLRTPQDVATGCQDHGIDCADGFQCLCSPCIAAYDVDVAAMTHGRHMNAGCSKFSVCGTVVQGERIVFSMMDNKKRKDLLYNVNILDTTTMLSMNLTHIKDAHDPFHSEFTFHATNHKTGIVVIQILADGEQIPESPLRLEIIAPDCVAKTGDANRVPDDYGLCVCRADSIEIGQNCVPFQILLPSIFGSVAVLAAIVMYFYIKRKKKQADSVWAVCPSELHFSQPPCILGRGTFGLVLLAEYRGTKVAVKRVLPLTGKRKNRRKGAANEFHGTSTLAVYEEGLEDGIASATVGQSYERQSPRRQKSSSCQSTTNFDFDDEEALNTMSKASGVSTNENENNSSPRTHNKRRVSWLIDQSGNNGVNMTSTKSGYASSGHFESTSGFSSQYNLIASRGTKSMMTFCSGGSLDKYARLKSDFKIEMRHLSKLRHPCITTVMGAVISKSAEPMMVMEFMDYGSLYDLLQNESMILDGELILPILRDIAQGIRFLHAASPQVIHGDLKAANVLIDARFRAKVADFGLSQKKNTGATGTPLWMAPELLRGNSENTAASDTYAVGILLYEMFSRKLPYEGEDHNEVLKLVADPKISKRPLTPKSCTKSISRLMADCLLDDPMERPSAEELDLRFKRFEIENVEPDTTISSLQEKKQAQAVARSEGLLTQVFPHNVGETLRDGLKVEAESFDCVTCLFSEIVGFSTISSKLHPAKVSYMLDRLYMRFDDLLAKFDLFKVETISDAYMAVTNLHKDQPDHASRVAKFCLAVVKASSETLIDIDDPGKGTVQIRAGFHSGPIVADVVGSRSLKYTLFGDTVSTASCLQRSSLCGQIQCSDISAGLVAAQDPTVNVTFRGKTTVKGKGEMNTFWISP